MRAVVQRVREASVAVDGVELARIGLGVVVYLGVGKSDGDTDVGWLAEKIAFLRIFEDERSNMNLSVRDTGGEALVISQFTLFGDCRRGRRPSFEGAMPSAEAEPVYERFLAALAAQGIRVRAGKFRAMMDVASINAGPVTILLDSAKLF
jgi:D-aminoacyl-tRNA deacylase